MIRRSNDRILVYIASFALIAMAAIFVGYSYFTADRIDRSAVATGSSTDPNAANGAQERSAADSRGPAKPSSSNVPPATSGSTR